MEVLTKSTSPNIRMPTERRDGSNCSSGLTTVPDKTEARRMIAELGNKVVYGASFEAVCAITRRISTPTKTVSKAG